MNRFQDELIGLGVTLVFTLVFTLSIATLFSFGVRFGAPASKVAKGGRKAKSKALQRRITFKVLSYLCFSACLAAFAISVVLAWKGMAGVWSA